MNNELKRVQLLEQVYRGDVTCEAAEEAAREQGWELLCRPAPELFNPMKQRQWTLGMALAWIAWRLPDKVRDFSDECRLSREAWRSLAHGLKDGTAGYYPRSLYRASVWSMLEGERVPGEWQSEYHDCKIKIAASWDFLLEKLQAGKLIASGMHLPSRELKIIPAQAWTQLTLGQHNWFGDNQGDVDALFTPDPWSAVYARPLVDERRIRKLWSSRIGRVVTTSAKAASFKLWLIAEMKNSRDHRPHPKRWYQEKARTEHGVGSTTFSSVWREAIADAGASVWSKGGAPRKTPRSEP